MIGGEKIGSDINWITITAHGSVTIVGSKYQHTTSVFYKKNPLASVSDSGNVLSIENATLVTSKNANDVVDRIYSFSELESVLTQTAVIKDQYAGQIVKSLTPWNTFIEGYVTSMESEFTTNGHTAKIVVSGKEA